MKPLDPALSSTGYLVERIGAYVAAHPGDRAVAGLARLVLDYRLSELVLRRGELALQLRQLVEIDPGIARRNTGHLTIVH